MFVLFLSPLICLLCFKLVIMICSMIIAVVSTQFFFGGCLLSDSSVTPMRQSHYGEKRGGYPSLSECQQPHLTSRSTKACRRTNHLGSSASRDCSHRQLAGVELVKIPEGRGAHDGLESSGPGASKAKATREPWEEPSYRELSAVRAGATVGI